ncbi:MAG: ROK family transcriptional regulator [Spirochaetia bacterium]|jgi:N-acetylglucosamine repressor|nr:ROK family transcriptional regulator [Spirochaetia bacterium]
MLEDYGNIQKERMEHILNNILNSREITRGELVDKLNLSPSTIVKYINKLIELGLVRESGLNKSTGGRRSIFLEFDPEIGVNIAIIINLSNIHGALVNPSGTIIEELYTPTIKGISKDELLNLLFILIEDLKTKAIKIDKRIFGIGLGMGDYMDMEKGISHEYLLARDWKEVRIKEMIESRFDLPFFLINDIDAGALGEKFYGRGIKVENFVCIWLSETVGMGMVLNDRLYFGKKGFVGEIGHTNVVPNGAICTCGNRGCLETVATTSFVLEKCREGIESDVYSEIIAACDGDINQLKIEDVITASNNGDRFVRNIFLEIAGYIGGKLSDIANILNPEAIILRGSIIDGNSFLFENIERIIKTQSLSVLADTIKVEYTDDKSDIRIPGVSSYILMNYFRR